MLTYDSVLWHSAEFIWLEMLEISIQNIILKTVNLQNYFHINQGLISYMKQDENYVTASTANSPHSIENDASVHWYT